MRPHPYCKLQGRLPFLLQPTNILPDLLLDAGKEEEVLLQLVCHPDARKILVAPAVAKPAAHLKQCVVGSSTSDEVAYDQSLERKSSRERVATNRDHNSGVVRRVHQPGFRSAIVHH